MAALPSDLSLTNIRDGSSIVAADHRNNYSAIEVWINAIGDLLAAGSSGQVLVSGGATTVSWGANGQKVVSVGTGTFPSNALPGWPSANAAILVPFTLQTAQTLAAIRVVTGNGQSGNFDVGVYDIGGSLKVSKGSTAQSTLTAAAVNTISVASTSLAAGQYYLALAADNTTGKFSLESSVSGMVGGDQLQVATSFPLPATITPGSTHPAQGVWLTAPVT